MDESNISKLLQQCKASGKSQHSSKMSFYPLISFSNRCRRENRFYDKITSRIRERCNSTLITQNPENIALLQCPDRYPTLTLSFKPSRHASEFHISTYRQLLFLPSLLFFLFSSPMFILVPLHHPHQLLPPLHLPALLLLIHILSDKLWSPSFLPVESSTAWVMLEKDHARKHARAWRFSAGSRSVRVVGRP
jgi:hypothetical protein